MYAIRRLYVAALLLAVVTMWGAPGLLGSLREPHAGPTVLIGAAMVGVALCLTRAWRMIRHMTTLLHELAHAIVAVFVGGRVHRITYSPDASGLATYSLPNGFGKIRRILAAGAGYCGPGVGGVVMMVAIRQDLSRLWLSFCAVSAAVALVIMIRSVWGVLYSLVLAGALWGASVHLGGALVDAVAAMCGSMLLVGGIRGALIQQRAEDLSSSDAGQLSKETYLPARFVATVHTSLSVALTGIGFAILLGILDIS